MVDPVLRELQHDSRTTPARLAELFGEDEQAVRERIEQWENDGTILGYHAVIDPDRAGHTGVTALIEVKLTPERDGGFDRIARRIAKFDQVVSCFLMSGAYDLAVTVEGENLKDVARFVAEKLSTIEGIISTATHFKLKVYKENGFATEAQREARRLPVTP